MLLSGPASLPPVDGDGGVSCRVTVTAAPEDRAADDAVPPPFSAGAERSLLEACAAGQEGPAAAALSAGAAPAATDPAGRTALHLVVAGQHSPGTTNRLVRLLHDWGAPLEAPDAQGLTPLLEAASAGNTAALLVLAELGAAWDAADQRNNTLLHLAAGSGNPQTVAAALDRLPRESPALG